MINNASLQVPTALLKAIHHVSPKSGAILHSPEVCCCKPQGLLLNLDIIQGCQWSNRSIPVCIILDSKETVISTVQVLIILYLICVNFDYLFFCQNFAINRCTDRRLLHSRAIFHDSRCQSGQGWSVCSLEQQVQRRVGSRHPSRLRQRSMLQLFHQFLKKYLSTSIPKSGW